MPDSVRPWRVDDDEADGALAWSLLWRGWSTGVRRASVHGEAAARRRRLEVEQQRRQAGAAMGSITGVLMVALDVCVCAAV